MTKPSWASAPSWAEWLVIQPDGSWWWFERQPISGCDEWVSTGGFSKCATDPIDWRETKESRDG